METGPQLREEPKRTVLHLKMTVGDGATAPRTTTPTRLMTRRTEIPQKARIMTGRHQPKARTSNPFLAWVAWHPTTERTKLTMK
jgi:hypothetical protein